MTRVAAAEGLGAEAEAEAEPARSRPSRWLAAETGPGTLPPHPCSLTRNKCHITP